MSDRRYGIVTRFLDGGSAKAIHDLTPGGESIVVGGTVPDGLISFELGDAGAVTNTVPCTEAELPPHVRREYEEWNTLDPESKELLQLLCEEEGTP